jgi:hypothetical protein
MKYRVFGKSLRRKRQIRHNIYGCRHVEFSVFSLNYVTINIQTINDRSFQKLHCCANITYVILIISLVEISEIVRDITDQSLDYYRSLVLSIIILKNANNCFVTCFPKFFLYGSIYIRLDHKCYPPQFLHFSQLEIIQTCVMNAVETKSLNSLKQSFNQIHIENDYIISTLQN